jgi:hypothetical protein
MLFKRVRRRGYYISPVKFYPYFPFELCYFPASPFFDPKRGYTIEVGAPIGGEGERTMSKRLLDAETQRRRSERWRAEDESA